jgi:hypothetical protein
VEHRGEPSAEDSSVAVRMSKDLGAGFSVTAVRLLGIAACITEFSDLFRTKAGAVGYIEMVTAPLTVGQVRSNLLDILAYVARWRR